MPKERSKGNDHPHEDYYLIDEDKPLPELIPTIMVRYGPDGKKKKRLRAKVRVSADRWPKVLPALLQLWPKENEAWNVRRLSALKKLIGTAKEPFVVVNLKVGRAQLERAGQRVAVYYSTPWKAPRYFKPNTPINQQSLKLRPGVQVSITIEGLGPTTARINTIRRVRYQGNPNYIKTDMTINTEQIPIFLDRETKCTCRFCGTKPVGDEEACRSCGAPLPC